MAPHEVEVVEEVIALEAVDARDSEIRDQVFDARFHEAEVQLPVFDADVWAADLAGVVVEEVGDALPGAGDEAQHGLHDDFGGVFDDEGVQLDGLRC